MRLTGLASLVLVVALALVVDANQVPQQRGNPCDAVWSVDSAKAVRGPTPRRPWELVCADGDRRCDRDGLVNDSCTIRVAACAATPLPGCTPELLTRLRISKATRRLLPGLVAPTRGSPGCGTTGTVLLPASTSDRVSVVLSMRTRSASGRGRNRLRVRCVPASQCVDCPTGCDASACIRDAPGLPRAMTLTVGSTGSDLDIGFSGDNHNDQITAGTRLDLCLAGCDATTDATCDVTPACGPADGEVIGAPQPTFSNGVPICIVTRRTATVTAGTVDLASGAMTVPLTVLSDVYVQTADTNGDNVCPRCSGSTMGQRGTCQAGAREGLECVVDGTANVTYSGGLGPRYNLSSSCLPDESKLVSTISLPLVLATGDTVLDGSRPCPGQFVDDSCGAGTCTVDCAATTPARGGINQRCCSNNPAKPCFPTAPDSPPGRIERAGVASVLGPVWPDVHYPKTGTGTVLAAIVCLPKTNDPTVDILAGLAAPGAVLVPVTVDVQAE